MYVLCRFILSLMDRFIVNIVCLMEMVLYRPLWKKYNFKLNYMVRRWKVKQKPRKNSRQNLLHFKMMNKDWRKKYMLNLACQEKVYMWIVHYGVHMDNLSCVHIVSSQWCTWKSVHMDIIFVVHYLKTYTCLLWKHFFYWFRR